MRLMSPEHALTMNRLVRLAYRDDRLVDAALKACARPDGTADLDAVMTYIKQRRQLPQLAPRTLARGA